MNKQKNCILMIRNIGIFFHLYAQSVFCCDQSHEQENMTEMLLVPLDRSHWKGSAVAAPKYFSLKENNPSVLVNDMKKSIVKRTL